VCHDQFSCSTQGRISMTSLGLLTTMLHVPNYGANHVSYLLCIQTTDDLRLK